MCCNFGNFYKYKSSNLEYSLLEIFREFKPNIACKSLLVISYESLQITFNTKFIEKFKYIVFINTNRNNCEIIYSQLKTLYFKKNFSDQETISLWIKDEALIKAIDSFDLKVENLERTKSEIEEERNQLKSERNR